MRSDKKSRKNTPIPGTRQYRKTQNKGQTEKRSGIGVSSSDKKRKRLGEEELLSGSRQYRKAQNRKKKKLFGGFFSKKKKSERKNTAAPVSQKRDSVRTDVQRKTPVREAERDVLFPDDIQKSSEIIRRRNLSSKDESDIKNAKRSAPKTGVKGKGKKSFFESKLFLLLIFVVGLMILSYPLISNKYYDIKQNIATDEYSKKMARMDKEKREKILRDAESYNRGLANINDNGYSENVKNYVNDSLKKKEIPSFFLTRDSIGRLKISSINVDLPVYYGTTENILKKGVGSMPNTSLPIGGMSTHSVLTGHRGLPESRLFRDLGELKRGDIFSVEVLGKKMAYQIDKITIVKPSDVSEINITPGKDYCTLLTCHPYMINSERMLVRGKRVPYVEYIKETKKKDNWLDRLKMFYLKYKEYLYGFLISLAILTLFYIIDRRRNKKLMPDGKNSVKNTKKKKHVEKK